MVALAGPITDGIPARLIVVKNPTYVDMAELKGKWANVLGITAATGFTQFSGLEDTTVGGEPAVMSEYQTANYAIEYIVVDHGGIRYLIGFSAPSSRFNQLWFTDAQKMLASFSWSAS